MNLEEKLNQLRKEWKTASQVDRKIIEMRAKALKMGMKAPKDSFEKIVKDVFLKADPVFKYKNKSPYSKNGKQYVSAPLKYFNRYTYLQIECNGESKQYVKDDIAYKIPHPDKYSGGIHTLAYFLWK